MTGAVKNTLIANEEAATRADLLRGKGEQTMADKVEAWLADDGSLHGSEHGADLHNAELRREGNIQEFVALCWLHSRKQDDMVEFVRNNWGMVADMVNEYQREHG